MNGRGHVGPQQRERRHDAQANAGPGAQRAEPKISRRREDVAGVEEADATEAPDNREPQLFVEHQQRIAAQWVAEDIDGPESVLSKPAHTVAAAGEELLARYQVLAI